MNDDEVQKSLSLTIRFYYIDFLLCVLKSAKFHNKITPYVLFHDVVLEHHAQSCFVIAVHGLCFVYDLSRDIYVTLP